MLHTSPSPTAQLPQAARSLTSARNERHATRYWRNVEQ